MEEVKKTVRQEDEKKNLKSKINRIIGQLNGIQKMIDDNRYCDDILIQLSAVNQSVKSLANNIIEKHLYNCVVKNIQSGNLEIIDEVIKLFRRFQ